MLRISLELIMAMLDQQGKGATLLAERDRLKGVYSKRALEIDRDMYAPWQPGEMLMLFERRRIELDEERASVAMGALPSANLIIGDASRMPWGDRFFDLVIISTVLSSVTSMSVRRTIADEVDRVLANRGTILIYDTAVRNPRNKDLLPVGRKQVAELFPNMNVVSRSVTLAPPIARSVAKRSWTLANILNALPVIRTHRLSLLSRSRLGE